jgi:hypothetical protein
MSDEYSVSLEDLSKAAAGVMETPKAEEKPLAEEKKEEPKVELNKEEPKEEPKNIVEEPDDNASRSKLGRRVSALETKIESEFSNLKNELFLKLETINVQPNDETYEDDDLDMPMTRREFMELEKKKIEAQSVNTKHIADYNAEFNKIKDDLEDEDMELHDKVMEELKKNHNIKRSTNGTEDARYNYLSAKVAVLDAGRKTPKNPLEKNKDNNPEGLGSPSGTSVDIKTKKTIKLDPDAEAFVNYVKSQDNTWTDEKVSGILDKEPSLRHVRHK